MNFEKLQLQSVSIFFKFVHPWLLFYLLRDLYLTLTFLNVSLNLAAVPSVCILIHFMTQLSLSNLNNCSFYFLFISSQISDLTQEAYFFKAVKRYSRGGWSFHQSYSNNFPNSWWEKQSRACQWEWRHLQNHVANNIHAWICKKYQYVYVFIYLDPLYMEWGTLV